MTQLEMFAVNIKLLIGLLVFGLLLVLLVVSTWTGIKVWLFRGRQRRGAQEEFNRRHRPDGTLLPPVAAGMCGQCSGAFDKVYHLPDGRRLCEQCYEETEGA